MEQDNGRPGDMLETIAWCRHQALTIMAIAAFLPENVGASMIRSTASDIEANLALLADDLAPTHSENNQ